MALARSLLVAVAATASGLGWWLGEQRHAASPTARVIEVIDGDTIVVELPDGGTDTVRILGVDTPNIAQHHPAVRAPLGIDRAGELKGEGAGEPLTVR